MLICIDGTGPANTATYARNMSHSFVSTIYDHALFTPKQRRYFRGPDWKGLSLHVPIDSLTAELRKDSSSILLVGYSRGGAIAIAMARRLADHGVPVEALFLFDAVDRSFLLIADRIPDNVRHVYHAIRASSVRSRPSFANCGLIWEGHLGFQPQAFTTTHGGMGGVPWGAEKPKPTGVKEYATVHAQSYAKLALAPQRIAQVVVTKNPVDAIDELDLSRTTIDATQEAKGMNEVKTWMWNKLRTHRVLA